MAFCNVGPAGVALFTGVLETQLHCQHARKHGGTKRRVWRKIHIGIDEQTLEIRAAELKMNDVGDAPMLPELLDQIPSDQGIASVTADGGPRHPKVSQRYR